VLIESDGSSLMPFLGTTIVFSALNSHAWARQTSCWLLSTVRLIRQFWQN
jgi:hypothetical protein